MDLSSLPRGSRVRVTLKGTARTIEGSIVGPYLNPMNNMPAVVINTGGGSFPEVAVALHTVTDVEVLSVPAELSETDAICEGSDPSSLQAERDRLIAVQSGAETCGHGDSEETGVPGLRYCRYCYTEYSV